MHDKNCQEQRWIYNVGAPCAKHFGGSLVKNKKTKYVKIKTRKIKVFSWSMYEKV